MSCVLVKFEANWADEMDVAGFVIMTDAMWNSYKEKVAEYTNFNFYIGSNQSIDFHDKDNFLSKFKVTEISDDEAQRFVKLFGASYDSRCIVTFGEVSLITGDEFFGMELE